MTDDVEVYLEAGSKLTFACALAWPGWARSAKTRDGEEAALEALLGHSDRYAAVAHRAGHRFPGSPRLRVVERLPGTATTDFGAPDARPDADRVALSRAERNRQVDLREAAWALLDEAQATASAELRKGPRGGGRDRDDVVRHVVEAERNYARTVGVRHKPFAASDIGARDALRVELASTLRTGVEDSSWAPAYFLRRSAWHVLDHAWEIQDKSL